MCDLDSTVCMLPIDKYLRDHLSSTLNSGDKKCPDITQPYQTQDGNHQQAELDEAVVLSEKAGDIVDIDRFGLAQVSHLAVVAARRGDQS